MGSVLAFTKSFASVCILRSRLISTLILPREKLSLGKVNEPTERNTRDANDVLHAKRLVRKKPLLAWEVLTIEIKMSHFPFNSLST